MPVFNARNFVVDAIDSILNQTYAELAQLIKETVGFKGDVLFDSSKPDGSPRKLLDVSLLKNLGWTTTKSLKVGLRHSYLNFFSFNIRK